MTDQEYQAWLDAHGGEVGRKNNEAEVDDPAHTGPLSPGEKRRQVKTVESTTVTAKDGATITLRRATGWSASPGGPQYDVTANTPPTRAADQSAQRIRKKEPVRDPASPTGWTEEITYEDGSVTRNVGIKSPEDKPVAPATVATNTTEPFIVTRQPDGSLTREDNPNYRGADPKPGATHFSVGGDGRTYAIPIDAQGRPGQAVDVGLPAKPAEAQSPYSQVQQDPDTKKWYGLKRDGKGWEEIPGGPGAAAAAPAGATVPRLPEITAQSQAALREYHAALQAEVTNGRKTQAWADARFTEAMAVARQTVDEANVVNNEAQSRRNADVSLMNNRQNAATTGFGQALDTVNAGNKYLPKGSTLGGEAFRALLGLQRGHAERMGAYTDPYGSQTGPGAAPGAPVAPPPVTGAPGPPGPPPGVDAATPAQAAGNLMLTVKNKATGAVATVLASVFQARPDRDQFEVIDAQNVVTPAATTPPSPGAPPAVDPATMPPGAVAPDPSSGLMMRAGLSDSGEPPPPNGAQLPVYRDRDGPSTYTVPWGGGGFDTVTTPPVDGVPNRYPQIPPDLMPLDPRDNRPDNTRRQLEDPNSSHSVYKTSRAAPQREDFAVLASGQSTPMAAPSLSMQAPAEPEPFAMMAARIRSTPPWRLSESDLNQFVAAGGDPADFWSDGITGVFR